MTCLADFLTELKHRRVFRVAAVYAGVAFIISEIVANTFGYLQIPDWVGTTIMVLLIIGFPIVIGLAPDPQKHVRQAQHPRAGLIRGSISSGTIDYSIRQVHIFLM